MKEERGLLTQEEAQAQRAELPVSDLFSLMPRTFEGAQQFCEVLAKSELVPKDYHDKAANIFVAIQCGAEIGLSPMQSIQSIAVINGRPSLWGDAVLALVQGSGKMEWIREWDEGDTSYCETKRRGYPVPYKTSFSDADAKAAGLLGKAGPWTSYKSRMRKMRARAFNLRDQYADVLKGTSVSEEVMDITPVVPNAPTPDPQKPLTQDDKGASVREKMLAKAGKTKDKEQGSAGTFQAHADKIELSESPREITAVIKDIKADLSLQGDERKTLFEKANARMAEWESK